MFPRQRNGLDYSLNWSLSADYISVWNNAFRNPSLSTLRQYTQGAFDSEKNVCCQRPFANDSDIFPKVDQFNDFAREVRAPSSPSCLGQGLPLRRSRPLRRGCQRWLRSGHSAPHQNGHQRCRHRLRPQVPPRTPPSSPPIP